MVVALKWLNFFAQSEPSPYQWKYGGTIGQLAAIHCTYQELFLACGEDVFVQNTNQRKEVGLMGILDASDF